MFMQPEISTGGFRSLTFPMLIPHEVRAEKVLTENFETKYNESRSGYSNEDNLEWKRNQNLPHKAFSNAFN